MGGSVFWRGVIQYKCCIPFCQIRVDLPLHIPDLLGQVIHMRNLPSLALDTTLKQDVTGRIVIEGIHRKTFIWGRVTYNILCIDRTEICNLYLKQKCVIPRVGYKIPQFIIKLWQQRFFFDILLKPFGISWEGKIEFLFQCRDFLISKLAIEYISQYTHLYKHVSPHRYKWPGCFIEMGISIGKFSLQSFSIN